MAPPPEIGVSAPLEGSGERRIAVLHVDDDPEFAEIVSTFLEREADVLSVETATSVREALDRLAEIDADCVVSDYDMPETNGVEFLRTVREEYGDLPFVLFTGKGSEEVASEAISAGVTDYLQKRGGTDQYALLANRIRNAVEQYRTERELIETTRTLEAIVEASPLPIVAVDPQGAVGLWNAAAEETFGWSASEVLGEYNPIVPDAKDEEFERLRDRVLDGESFTGTVIRRRTADGDEIDLILSTAPVRDADGEVNGVMAVFDEVETRERVLEDLHVATRDLFDARSPTAVCEVAVEAMEGVLDMPINACWLYDAESETLEPAATTSRTRELVGDLPTYAEGNSLSWRAFATGEPEVFEDVTARPDAYDPETPIRSEMILPLGEHGVLNVGSTAVAAFDESDLSLARLLAENARAALDRVERERDLWEERCFFEGTLDALDDLFYVFDTERRLLRWNDRISEVTGYTDAEIGEMTATDFFAEADRDRVANAIEEAIETGDAKVRADLLTANGDRVPYEFTGSRLVDPEGELVGFCGIGRDVTEREARERDLRRQIERLDEFASIVSHDLRNPLNVLQGTLDMAEATGDPEHFERAREAADRMDHLIDDLLALARQGEAIDEVERVRLDRFVRKCWDGVATATATLDVDTERAIHADESRLRQLFENLFRNAVEHGGEDVFVTVGDLPDGFYVADDGPGIPAADRWRVFDAGYTTSEEGTGFGLSIVERVAEAHGWDVTITESVEGGVRFEVTGVEFA